MAEETNLTVTSDSAAVKVEAEAEAVADAGGIKRQLNETIKLGYKTLANGNEACAYFKHIMQHSPKNINLNQYEAKALSDLLKLGHPMADKKIGSGLAGFQVREFNESGALAFYVVRKDGSFEDFSYIKCCAALFSDVGAPGGGDGGAKRQERDHGGRGRGGRGRGRGPRGRGRGGGRR